LYERASVIFLDFDRLYISRRLLGCIMSIDMRIRIIATANQDL
jgi:hypothetical protein